MCVKSLVRNAARTFTLQTYLSRISIKNKAMNDLHQATSWDIESVFGSWFSGGYIPFVRNVMFFVALLIVVIILIVTIGCVKACVIKLTTITASQFVIIEPMTIIEGNAFLP